MSRSTAILMALVIVSACQSTPKFAGYTADELFTHGERAFQDGDWEEAVEAFELLTTFDPDFPRMGETRVFLAESYYQQGDFLTAASEFIRVLSRHGGTPVEPTAALGVCRSYVGLAPIPQRDQTHTTQALNSCGNTAVDYRGTEEGTAADSLATLMLERLAEKDYSTAEFYFSRDFYDSARVYYEEVLESYSTSSYAPRSLLRLYELFTVIGYDDLAEEARTRLLAEYPDSEAAKSIPAAVNTGSG